MTCYEVHAKIRHSLELPENIDAAMDQLRGDGWTVKSYGVGSEESNLILSDKVPLRVVVCAVGRSPDEASVAVENAVKKHAGYWATLGSNFSAGIIQPLKDTANDIAQAADNVKRGVQDNPKKVAALIIGTVVLGIALAVLIAFGPRRA